MNFLSHLLLSGDDEQVMVGNFIGDFVKGAALKNYSPKIQEGIILHRHIDTYTDNHPLVMESKVRLRDKFRHYAPVIVDVFYDHFVAKHWNKYNAKPLLDYTEKFYATMKNYYEIIPRGVINMLGYMSRDNWLYNYQFIEGIDKALTGLSRRTKFDSKMDKAAGALQENYSDFENEFIQFFPELQLHVRKFKV